MTPKEQTLIERRSNKLLEIKVGFVRELYQAAHDCGARCVIPADEQFCMAKLKDAANLSRLGKRLSAVLLETTIQEGLNDGKSLADKAIADRWRDPWETQLANIPARLIHCAPNGRELVTSADLMTHVLNVPKSAAAGRRLAPAMTLNGWRRHASQLVKIGGRNFKGYWRFREAGQ